MRLQTFIFIMSLVAFAVACKSSSETANAPLWQQLVLAPEQTHKRWGGNTTCLHKSPFQYATHVTVNRAMASLNCQYTKANGNGYKVARSFFEQKKPAIIELKLDKPQPMTGQTIASIVGMDPGISEKFTGFWPRRSGHHGVLWRNLPAELTQQKLYRVDALPTNSDGTKTEHVILYIKSSPRAMALLSRFNGDIQGVNAQLILPSSSTGAVVDEFPSVMLTHSQLTLLDPYSASMQAPKILSSRSALKSALVTNTLPESTLTVLSNLLKKKKRERSLLQQVYTARLYLAVTRAEPMEVVAPLLYSLKASTNHHIGLLVRLSPEDHLGPVGVKYFAAYPTVQKEERKAPRLFVDLTDGGIKISHEVNADGMMKLKVMPPVNGCATKDQTICTTRPSNTLRVQIEKAQVIDQGLKTFGTKEGQAANLWYQQIYKSYDWATLRKTLVMLKQQYPDLEPIVRTAPNTPVGLTLHLVGQMSQVEANKPAGGKNTLYDVKHIGLIP